MKNVLKTFILCAVVLSFSFLVLNSATAFAQKDGYKLTVPLPEVPEKITGPAQYIKYLYQFGLGIGALLAIAIIVFAGIKYSVSAGNVAQQEDARDMIKNAVLGLALLLGAVLIMYTINPKLVGLGALEAGLQLEAIKPPAPAVQDTTVLDRRIKSLDLENADLPRLRDLKNFYEKDCAKQKANLNMAMESIWSTPGLGLSESGIKSLVKTDPKYHYLRGVLSKEELENFINSEGWGGLETKESKDRANVKLKECYDIINSIDLATAKKKAAQSAESMSEVPLAELNSRHKQLSRLLFSNNEHAKNTFDVYGGQSPEYLKAQKVVQFLADEIAQLDKEIKRRGVIQTEEQEQSQREEKIKTGEWKVQ